MTDLLVDPFWREQDLGKPLPDNDHAVSVSMPRWQHVIGYEEQDPEVVNKLFCGYPRFFRHRYVSELIVEARRRFCKAREDCFVYPTAEAARRCINYVEKKGGKGGRIEEFGVNDLKVVVIGEDDFLFAKNYWRFLTKAVAPSSW